MKQGEIWLINLDPTTGSEIKKIRPAIIVNNDDFGKLPLRVIGRHRLEGKISLAQKF